MGSAGTSFGIIVVILAILAPPAAPQAAPCPETCAGTVSVGVLIGSCVAVLIGTLLIELAILLCYRHCCTKPCSSLTSSNSDFSSEEALAQPKDYHAASWSYRGGPKQKDKNKNEVAVFNISESKEKEDKVMFSPGLYRTSLSPKTKGKENVTKSNAIMVGADNYVPEFPTIYSYNSGWDNRVDQILNKHARNDQDDASMVSIDLDDDEEFPILKAPKDGVGSVNFSSAKFGIHNHGFQSPDSISLSSSENGDLSTFRYIAGVGGKTQHEITMEEGEFHRRPKGTLVTQDNTVIDMEWDGYADPDTRISIDDNFLIGPPSISTSDGTDEIQPDGVNVDSTGNFILRKLALPVRSDSSDEDLYDYGESDTERVHLSEKHGEWSGSFSRATYKAKMGKVLLEHDAPPADESQMPEFGSRFRYSTGLRHAKVLAMRAAAAPTSRQNDQIEQQRQQTLSHRPVSPEPVVGYIKLVRPDTNERVPSPEPMHDEGAPILGHIRLARPEVFDKAIYHDTHFRLARAPGNTGENDDLMVLYPISSKDTLCRHCRGRSRDTTDSAAQATTEKVHASTLSHESTQRSGRQKKDPDVDTIGVIRLLQPYESGTMSSTMSKKQVRFKDQPNTHLSSDSMRSTSSDHYTSVSTDDEVDAKRSSMLVRETSRSSKRGSSDKRKRRSKSVPVRGPQREEESPLPTIGVIRLVSPETTADTGTLSSDQGYSSPIPTGDRPEKYASNNVRLMDTEELHTIGILKLVSPPTSPRPTRSERLQHTSSPTRRVRSPEGRVRSPERRVRSPERRVRSPERRVRSPERRVRSPERRFQSPERTIGLVKLVSPKPLRKMLMKDATTEPHVPWSKLLHKLQECVEEEVSKKSAKHSVSKDVGKIKLKRPEGLFTDTGTQPEQTWFEVMQDIEDIVEEKYRQRGGPAKWPRESADLLEPRVNNVGMIKLSTPVSRKNVQDKASQPDFSWRQMMSEFEDEIRSTLRRQQQQPTQAVIKIEQAPLKNLKPAVALTKSRGSQSQLPWGQLVRKIQDDALDEYHRELRREREYEEAREKKDPRVVSVVKLKGTKDHPKADSFTQCEQMSTEDFKPAVTLTKSRGSQAQLPWGQLVRKIQDDALDEYHRKLRREREHEGAREKKDPRVVSVVKLKGAKDHPKADSFTQCEQMSTEDFNPAVTLTKSRGSQAQLPWGQLVRKIQDDGLDEYRRKLRREREHEDAREKKDPRVVSVVKLKGAKDRPKADSFTQSEQTSTEEQTTQPDRSWDSILKDMKQILENEYRRTINELETRLSEKPMDEPDFGKTSPTIAVFKLKGSPKAPTPQSVAAFTQCETPQLADQDTQPDRSWSKVVSDVRGILENEYRRTIKELEHRLTEPESKTTPTVAVFKLKESKNAPVNKPNTADSGTQAAKPWGEILTTVRDSVENEYRQIIRDLQSELAMPKDEPKAKSLGFFKITGTRAPKMAPKRQSKEKSTGPMFPWSTVVRNVEDTVERRFRKQQQTKKKVEEPEIVSKHLGIFTLKRPKRSAKQYQELVEELPVPKQLGVITLKSPNLNAEIGSDMADVRPEVTERSTSPVEELIVPKKVQIVESRMADFGVEIGIQVDEEMPLTSNFGMLFKPSVRATGSATMQTKLVHQHSQVIAPKETESGIQVKPECADFANQVRPEVRHAFTSPTRRSVLSLSPVEITSKAPDIKVMPNQPIQEFVTRQTAEPVQEPVTCTIPTRDSYTQAYRVPTVDSMSQHEYNQTSVMIQVEPETRHQNIGTIKKQLQAVAVQLEPLLQKNSQTQYSPNMRDSDTMTLVKYMKDSGTNYETVPKTWKQTQASPPGGSMASTQTMLDVLTRWTQYEQDTIDNWVQVATIQCNAVAQTDGNVPEDQPEIIPEQIQDIKASRYSYMYDSDSGVDTNTQTEPVVIVTDSSSDTDIELMDSISQTEPGVFSMESDYSDDEMEFSVPQFSSEVIRIANFQEVETTPAPATFMPITTDADAQTVNDVKDICSQTKAINVKDRAVHVAATTHLAQTQTYEPKKVIMERHSQTKGVEQSHQSCSTDPAKKSYAYIQTEVKPVVDRSSSPITNVVDVRNMQAQTTAVNVQDRGVHATAVTHLAQTQTYEPKKIITARHSQTTGIEQTHRSSSTDPTQKSYALVQTDVKPVTDRAASPIQPHVVHRAASPIQTHVVDRAASPIQGQLVHRANSPILVPSKDLAVQATYTTHDVFSQHAVDVKTGKTQTSPKLKRNKMSATDKSYTIDSCIQTDPKPVKIFEEHFRPIQATPVQMSFTAPEKQTRDCSMQHDSPEVKESPKILVNARVQVEPITLEARTQSDEPNVSSVSAQTDFPEAEPIHEVIKVAQVSPVETPRLNFGPTVADGTSQTFGGSESSEHSFTQTTEENDENAISRSLMFFSEFFAETARKEYRNSVTQTAPSIDVDVVQAESYIPTESAPQPVIGLDSCIQVGETLAMEDQYTETLPICAVDFTAQAKPLTIEQMTATDIVTQVSSEVQVQMDEKKAPMQDSEVQHEPVFETLSTSIQVEPMRFNQGTSTHPVSKQSVGVQFSVPMQKPRRIMWQNTAEMTDKGTSTQVHSSENMTQTRVPQSEAGVQMTPDIKTTSVASTAKPEMQDHTSTTKPEVMEIHMQATPVQKNEGSQYERTGQVDVPTQYERLESEDTSVQVKAVIRDQASSPIAKRKCPSMATQTDAVDEELLESFIGEEPIQKAEIISVMSAPDQSITALPYAIDQATQADLRDEYKPLTGDIGVQYEISLRDASAQIMPLTIPKGTETTIDSRPKSIQVKPSTLERGTFTLQPRNYDRMTQARVETIVRSTSPLFMYKTDAGTQYDALFEAESVIEPVKMAQVHSSMSIHPSYASVEKIRLRDEVKEEMRVEIREEVIEDIKEEIRDDVKEVVRMEIRDEIKEVVRMEIERDVKRIVRRELEEEVRDEMTVTIRDEVMEDVREELQIEFESRIRFEMEDRHRQDIEFRVRGDLEPKIRMELEPIIRHEVEKELREQIPPKPICVDQATSPIKEVVFSKPTQTTIKTTTRGTNAERLPASNAMTQVQPTTFTRGTNPRLTDHKVMSVQASIPMEDKIVQFNSEPATKIVEDQNLPGGPPSNQISINVQTEVNQRNEATQASANQKVSFTQYEPLYYIDRTLQVQPVMVNQSTTMSPLLSRKLQTQTPNVVDGSYEYTDSFMQHEFDVEVEHRQVQISPVTREEANSPLPFPYTNDQSTSPYDVPEADYTPPGLGKLKSNRPITLSLGTKKSPGPFSPVMDRTPLVIEEPIRPIENMFSQQSPPNSDECDIHSFPGSQVLSPTTQNMFSRLDYSLRSTSKDSTPVTRSDPSRQFKYTYTRYDDRPADTKESYTLRLDRDSTIGAPKPQSTSTPATIAPYQSNTHIHSSNSRDVSEFNTRQTANILPQGTQVIVVQTTSPRYTTAIITNTSPTLTTSLTRSRPSGFTSLSPILSSISSLSDISSSDDMDELEQIRRDLRLSQVIITDDPATLIHFLLNSEVFPHRRQTTSLPRPRPITTNVSVLFKDTSHTHRSLDFHHVTPNLDLRSRRTYNSYSSRSVLEITGSPSEVHQPFKSFNHTPGFRLNVNHDSKGSPRPGSGLSPPRSTSPVPLRITPEEMARLPIPRGMVTRLSDLLDVDGNPKSTTSKSDIPLAPPKFDRSVQDLGEFFDSYQAIDNFFSPDKKDSNCDSEPDTVDSDTDSEHWQAVLDFSSSNLFEDPHYWSDEPGRHSPSSEDSYSEDDDVSVCCTYDLLYSNLPQSIPASSDEEHHAPGEPLRRRRPRAQIDSKKVRSELELTEVIPPKSEDVKLTGYTPNGAEKKDVPDAYPYSWSYSLGNRERTRSEPDIMSLIRDEESIPGSPTPSLASSHTSERLKDRLAAAAKGGLTVDTEFVPASLDHIRYASLVSKKRSPIMDNRPRFGRTAQLSQSEPDLAAEYSLPSSGVPEMGSF